MLETLSRWGHRAIRTAPGDRSPDARPVVPDGQDLPGQRMARDNSRAVPADHLSIRDGAILTITPALAQLLAIEGHEVDLNTGAPPVFATPVATRAAKPSFNIPPSSWRYQEMPVVELLEEVARRAIGEGPGDAVVNAGVRPEYQRLGDMAFALRNTPGRELDTLVLRNAGLALGPFFFGYRTMVEDMRSQRPDLAPVMPQWTARLARDAVALAVAIPLGDDGEPQYEPRLYGPINAAVQQPFETYIPALEQRFDEQQRETFIDQSQRFFARIKAPIVFEAPRENRVLGAADNEIRGSGIKGLIGGTVVFRCADSELRQNLQMMPAGWLLKTSEVRPQWSVGTSARPRYSAFYPDRSSGTTIKRVEWQNAAGVTKAVIVANWQGVHSFSFDAGRHWQPTGGPMSEALDDLRADGWRQLLADRWHIDNLMLSEVLPIGGR